MEFILDKKKRNTALSVEKRRRQLLNKDKDVKPFSPREKSLYYGLTNTHEFITMTMEDKGFQKMLNEIPFKEDKTILQRIKDLINEYITELAKEIGFDIKDNSALKSSIENIIDLINYLFTSCPFFF